MTRSTKQHWESYWSVHFLGVDPRLPEYEKDLVDTARRWIDVAGKRLMEVGCGSGRNSVHFARQGARVSVVDYSPAALAIARGKARAAGVDLDVVQADAAALPFADDRIDLIYHSGFLEHFPDPAEILREQIRILKRGGYLLVDVPQKYTIYTIKKHISMWRGTWYAGWETEYSPGALYRLIASHGLQVVDMYPRGLALSYGWTARNLALKAAALVRRCRPAHAAGAAPPSPRRRRWMLYLTDSIGIVGKKT